MNAKLQMDCSIWHASPSVEVSVLEFRMMLALKKYDNISISTITPFSITSKCNFLMASTSFQIWDQKIRGKMIRMHI